MKTQIATVLVCALFFAACSKKENPTPETPSSTYLNSNAGSSWTYQTTDSSTGTPNTSSYTVTSSSSDTTITGTKYHVYNLSYGGNQYMALSGHDYYQYDSIPVQGGVSIGRLYLKDNLAAGATWTQDINLDIPQAPVPITLTATNKVAEKGISRTVNGVTYSDVIHISTTLSSALITSGFTSSIDSYYAPNYGLIENTMVIKLDYLTLHENLNTKTILMSADLK